MIRILHTADWHLDTPFSGLPPQLAKERRRERRDLADRIADLVKDRQVQLVLMSGDIFDSEQVYPETVERVVSALRRMACPVFIAPGNHDHYRPGGIYDRTLWPENVHVFTEETLRSVELPQLNATVWGAAFVGPAREKRLLANWSVPDDGRLHLMVFHGDVITPNSSYGPVSREEIAASGLDCLCMGHVHKQLDCSAGRTACHYTGCPEGRGFDELGDCGVLIGEVEKDRQTWEFVSTCRRRYEILELDVTGREPAAVLEEAMPPRTVEDIYRVIFVGEAEGLDLKTLESRFAPRFYSLELRDKTRVAEDIWTRAEEDSLRGLFLKRMRGKYDAAETELEREQIALAVRYGLAALDGRDL